MSHRIVSVSVSSVRGCELAEVAVGDRDVLVVGGNNGAGKSSFLDAICITLGGKRLFPKNPIYNDRGEAYANVRLEGESNQLPWPCTVTRTISESEEDKSGYTTKVTIQADDGSIAPSPQTILNDILGKGLQFDPLKFVHEKPAVQAGILKDMVGLDFTALDAEYDKVYADRTHVNRLQKQVDGKLKQTPIHVDLPAEKISVAKLMDQLREINGHNAEVRSQETQVADIERQIDSSKGHIQAKLERIEEIKKEIVAMKEEIAAHERTLQAIEANPIEPRDPEPIQQQIERAELINHKFDENAERLELIGQQNEHKAEYKRLTKRLKAIETEKTKLSDEAEWPVQGMGFTKDGVTLNGIPFEDLSSSEQLNCAVCFAFKLNPVFPFAIIRDGSLLDEKHLKELEIITKNHKGQVFIERVGEGSECHVVFENGRMRK